MIPMTSAEMGLNLREFPYFCEVCRSKRVESTFGARPPLPDEQVHLCGTCNEITLWKLVGPKDGTPIGRAAIG